jgi:hypothetical protein
MGRGGGKGGDWGPGEGNIMFSLHSRPPCYFVQANKFLRLFLRSTETSVRMRRTVFVENERLIILGTVARDFLPVLFHKLTPL